MKKLNLFVMAVVAAFGFTVSAHAASGVTLTCDKENIKVGESTNCIVSFNADAPIGAAVVELSVSETLDVSAVKAKTTAGWAADADTTDVKNAKFGFVNSKEKAQLPSKGQLFAFTLTVNEKAKKLNQGDSCGNICIKSVQIGDTTSDLMNDASFQEKGKGTCFAPTYEEEKCVGEDCNPKTGAFTNYAVILGALALAAAGVVVARKSTKFFRI